MRVIGEKGKKYMWTDRIKKHQEFTDEEIGEIRIIEDFLPPPDKLVFKKNTVKITLSLNSSSINFFKQQAKLHHTQYQKMIRALLDQYVQQCLLQENKNKIKAHMKAHKTKSKKSRRA